MIVIFNPTAGKRSAARLWQVLDVLTGSGVRVRLRETTHPGHATELARQAVADGAALVVAAGGDGTIAEVAAGVNGSAIPMGIIPLGTANVLAQELRLPGGARPLAAALAFRRTRVLWPGLASGPSGTRLFVQMVGVGLDAQVVHHLPLGLKRCLGRGAYAAQTLREMVRYSYRPIQVRIDGVACQAGSVVVSKGSLYGGNFLLAPDARPGERGFSVALFGGTGPFAAAKFGAALVLNVLPRVPGMRLLRASQVEIEGDSDMKAQADGDPAGAAPLTVRDAESPISVVVA